MRIAFQYFCFALVIHIGGFCFQSALAQDVRVSLGPSEIALNEFYTITITIDNENLRSHSPFPEIPGFIKRSTSSQTSSTIRNGRMTFSQSLVQNYQATKEGKYSLKPFTMDINGQQASATGATITVGPSVQRQQFDPFALDPFSDMFGVRPSQPKEFIDVQEDAFFAVSVDKEEVYIGEGFNLNISFYVGQANKAQMQFFELGEQLGGILKKIKPTNCWEENYGITEIQQSVVEINNKKYTRYKIFEANYFPLTLEPVLFPSVGLKMVKFKVAKNPSFFGNNVQQDFKEFFTKPRIVKVKDLPQHPMKDVVAVGEFKLDERLEKRSMTTGEHVAYGIKITGIGNISSLAEPRLPASTLFEFYSPSVTQSVRRENGRVLGSKGFDYYFVAKEPGEYDLSKHLIWVFFNPVKNKYDTLRSAYTIEVNGLSMRNATIDAASKDNNRQLSDGMDNVIRPFHSINDDRIWYNLALLFSAALVGWTMFKRS